MSIDRSQIVQESLQEEEQISDLPDSSERAQPGRLRRRSEFGSQVVYMGSSDTPRTQPNAERFTCVCGALLTNEEITLHMSEECPKRLTLCQYCQKQVGHAELQVSPIYFLWFLYKI